MPVKTLLDRYLISIAIGYLVTDISGAVTHPSVVLAALLLVNIVRFLFQHQPLKEYEKNWVSLLMSFSVEYWGFYMYALGLH